MLQHAMSHKHINLAKALTLLGAVPFVAPIVAHLLGYEDIHLRLFALSYGAIIAAFLCGIHWGLFLTQAQQTRFNLLITSNVFTLFAWGSLLTLIPHLQYFIQIACFISLLIIDRELAKEGVIPMWFFNLRKIITSIVLLSLLVMAWLQ